MSAQASRGSTMRATAAAHAAAIRAPSAGIVQAQGGGYWPPASAPGQLVQPLQQVGGHGLAATPALSASALCLRDRGGRRSPAANLGPAGSVLPTSCPAAAGQAPRAMRMRAGDGRGIVHAQGRRARPAVMGLQKEGGVYGRPR